MHQTPKNQVAQSNNTDEGEEPKVEKKQSMMKRMKGKMAQGAKTIMPMSPAQLIFMLTQYGIFFHRRIFNVFSVICYQFTYEYFGKYFAHGSM